MQILPIFERCQKSSNVLRHAKQIEKTLMTQEGEDLQKLHLFSEKRATQAKLLLFQKYHRKTGDTSLWVILINLLFALTRFKWFPMRLSIILEF